MTLLDLILNVALVVALITLLPWLLAYWAGRGWWTAERKHRTYKPTDVFIKNQDDR